MSDADRAAEPPAGTGSDLSLDERAELERLRSGTATPHTGTAPPARRAHAGWRPPVALVLIVVGCLLAPLSVLAVWTANEVSSTSRYVANVEPLVHDPAVQNALTGKITTEITTHLNLTGHTDQAAAALTSHGLPRAGTLLQSLGPAISSAAAGFIHGQVHKIVTSPQFARVWVQANAAVHEQLVKALSGQGGSSVSVSNGQVVLSLGPFINLIKQDLVKRGFTLVSKLPAINPTLSLFSARYLVKAQSGYRLVNDLKIVLPIVTLLLLALGVTVARGHRRALIGAGLGLAASMLVLGAGLVIFRGVYLNGVPGDVLPADAAAALFDTLVRFIREGLRTILVVGLVVAAGAFLTGPSASAVKTRKAFSSGLGWVRKTGEDAGVRTGPVGIWTYAHRKGLRICAVCLAALLFVFWGRPTAVVVVVIAVLLLVVLGLIELVGSRPAPAPATAAHP
jgi:hypothetical protein